MLLLQTWATCLIASAAVALASSATPLRNVMYLTGQHVVVPSRDLARHITHVALAFMRSDTFNVDKVPEEFPLFMSVDEARTKFERDTMVMVAIGGWGDTGFETAAVDETSRRRWCKNVRAMVDATGADGVDIDWEYPGGNRDDYKKIPNSERTWEIEAFVELLKELRKALGSDKLITIAVPGVERDLMAFTPSTIPKISDVVDFINVMTYDMMIRRDTVVRHHSGVAESRESLQRYIDRGASPHQLNIGLGYYAKWFLTESDCEPDRPLGCPTELMEDPETGEDLGKTGGFSWHDQVPEHLEESLTKAKQDGMYFEDGSFGYWDRSESRWWSFDTPRSITSKIPSIITELGLGGVFAWGLGEDAPDFAHLRATIDGVNSMKVQLDNGDGAREEL